MNKTDFLKYVRNIDEELALWIAELPIIENMPDVIDNPCVYCVNCWKWDSPVWGDLYERLERRYC